MRWEWKHPGSNTSNFTSFIWRLCEQIFTQVLSRLIKISDEADLDYQLILINYIVEGCIRMFEPEIKVHVMEKDIAILKSLLPDVVKSF